MYQVSWLLPAHSEISSPSLDFQEGDKPLVLLAWCPLVVRGSVALIRLSRAWSQPHLPDDGLTSSQSPHLDPTPLSRPLAVIQHVPPAGGLTAVAQASLEQDRGGAHHPKNPPGSAETTLAKRQSGAELCGSSASAGPGLHQRQGLWGCGWGSSGGVGGPNSREGNCGGLFATCWDLCESQSPPL